MSDPADWCDPAPEPDGPVPGTPGVELPTPPKPWQIGDLRPEQLSTLVCSLGWRAGLITGLIRDLLIQHFADPDMAENPIFRLAASQGRPNVWREGEDTGILIESIHRWRGDIVGKRPAIVIKRNSYSSMRLGIADHVSVDNRGFQNYELMWVGSHTAFCIHGSGAGVEMLAGEVQRELTQFHPLMTRYMQLMRWMVTEVGAISEIEEAKETFAVPISIGWAYTERWTVEKESPKLRRFTLRPLFQL